MRRQLKLDSRCSSIVGMTKWGVDYSFDCTGNVQSCARRRCAHRG